SYTSDLIIYPDRVDPSWWRQKGHLLQIEDLKDILKEGPGILIIGTGVMGVMRVPKELKKQLEAKSIELYVERTGKAVEVFNSADKRKKVIGAFHLTC
ncbi:MTH938/NDUFAF3 family protein, partial [Acidobacteriota bacterium]